MIDGSINWCQKRLKECVNADCSKNLLILWYWSCENQVSLKQNNCLFSKTSSFNQANEFYIPRGSAITFFRCGWKFNITCIKFLQDSMYQNYWNWFLFDSVFKKTRWCFYGTLCIPGLHWTTSIITKDSLWSRHNLTWSTTSKILSKLTPSGKILWTALHKTTYMWKLSSVYSCEQNRK